MSATPGSPPRLSPAERRDWIKALAILSVLGVLVYLGWQAQQPFAAPSEAAVFEVASGTWDWETNDSLCASNPHTVSFSDDYRIMTITSRRPWSDSAGATERAAVYDILEHSRSHIRGAIRGETRITEEGKPVVWDLVLRSRDAYAWHRTDWEPGATTGKILRCPPGTDSLITAVD